MAYGVARDIGARGYATYYFTSAALKQSTI